MIHIIYMNGEYVCHKTRYKNIKFDLSFTSVIAIQLILIISIISVVINNDPSVMSHILLAITTMIGWVFPNIFVKRMKANNIYKIVVLFILKERLFKC